VSSRGRAALVAALAFFSLSCNLTDRKPVTLQLSTNGSCVRTSLACGGEIGVYVADAMTDELLDSQCVSFGPDSAMTLDKLPSVLTSLPQLKDLPQGRAVVVELAIWSPGTGKSCPRFSPSAAAPAGGAPSYFGRSGSAMAGAMASINLSLTCFPSSCVSCTKYASLTGVDPPEPNKPDAGSDAKADAPKADAAADARTDAAGDAKADTAPKPDAAVDAKADAAPAKTSALELNEDGGVADARPEVGSAQAPFRTVGKLLAALSNGQTGCLEEGTFVEDVTFPKGGSGSAPITLAAAPGAHPVLKGVLTIPDTTDNIAITGLTLDGATAAKSASPLIRGDRVALRGNEITNAGADCITLGDQTFGPAKTASIEGNRIHGCVAGIVGRVAESSLVANNFIYDNTGDGVSLFPNGDSITIERNIIDGNAHGVLFGSDGKVVSINDNVRFNVISNSTVGFNVYSAFPAAVGTGNNANQNCLWMGKKGDVATPPKGFSVKDNVTADPMYVDRAAKNFALAPTSPCLAFGPLR
jgi:hypothetical protein